MGKKFIEIIKKKWLRSVALTILLFAIIVCAYLAIYLGIEKLNINDLDFTKDKIYSISQATKDKLGNLSKDVKITVYNMYEYVNDFANKYANLNDHISVEKLENLTSKTNWKNAYGLTDDSQFLMIESGEKEKLVSSSDLYTYDYTTYEEIDITEEAITNAILDVTIEKKPKVYFLTGHNAYSDDYFSYLQESLTKEANEVETLDILKKGKVPDDCKILVLTTLKNDITAKEKDEIIKYIKKGGEILLLLDPNLAKIKLTNFQKVLDEYGVSISDGFILEGDSSSMMSGMPDVIIANVNSSEIIKNANMQLNLCLMTAGKLSFADSEKLEEKNVTTETLATVSSKAFLRNDLTSNSTSKISSDENADSATVAAMLTKKIDDEKTSKLIVFSNTVFATNSTLSLGTGYYTYAINLYNNEDILLNSISYLAEREDTITIRKTGEAVTTYDVNEWQTNLVLGLIFGIPVVIIFLGIIIWVIRRRKK